MKKSLDQTLLEDFLFCLTNLWEDEAIQSEVSLPNLSKMVQKTLPGVPKPAEFTTTVNNLKPFQRYVKQASRTQFPSALGGQIIPRVVNLEGGLEKYIFNRVRDKETVLASVVWDPSSKRIVGQHLEQSKLTPEELEYVKTWINNNLYGSPFNPNSVIPTNIHENQQRQQHQSAELTAQELDPLNYHGGDSHITTLLHKATKEVGPKRNHLELLMSFLARKEEEHQGYIEKLLADNEEQRAEIEMLIKDIGNKEKRFQDFNQEVSRLKTMPIQKQAQQAQQLAQTPAVQESFDDYLLKKLANKLTNLWEDDLIAEAGKSLRNSNPCWKGYHPVGTKKKGGKTVPNCVPSESVAEAGLNAPYTPSPAKPFRNPRGFNKQGTGVGNKLADLNRKEWEEKKKKEQGVAENVTDELHAELSDKYNELAPGIEKYKDEKGADHLYKELLAIARHHGAERKFIHMCNGARNSAHMDYDTNPGHFKNWFWYLGLGNEQGVAEGAGDYKVYYMTAEDHKLMGRYASREKAEQQLNQLQSKYPDNKFIIWTNSKQGMAEDWNKVNHHDKTNGLSQKAVNAYRREHPGSKLKTAVTTKPSKLKPGSKAAKRRKSFCARMSGNKGPMKKPNGKPTPKALALRRWHCESLFELFVTAKKGIYEAEGEPSGLKHLTPHLAKDILDQIETEGVHAIVKSIEWGDGGAKELIDIIKRELKKVADRTDERFQPASSFAGSKKNKINGKGMLPANAKFAKAGDLVGGG